MKGTSSTGEKQKGGHFFSNIDIKTKDTKFLKKLLMLWQPLGRKLRMLVLLGQVVTSWTKSFYLSYPFTLDNEALRLYHNMVVRSLSPPSICRR